MNEVPDPLVQPAPGEVVADAPRVESRHQLATDLVLAMFRMVRGYQLHANNNASLSSLVTFAAQVLVDYCARANTEAASITFTASTIFVDGRQLRARREAYDSALELGVLLDRCGVSEMVLPAAVGPTTLGTFARAFADHLRNPIRATPLGSFRTGGIRLRRVRIDLGAAAKDCDPADKALNAYASAVVVTRKFLDRVAKAPTHLPNQLKRVAQKLVSQLDEDSRFLIGLSAAAAKGGDEATVSVNTAIVAAATARQVVTDRVVLANLAMAAMMMNTGRVYLGSLRDGDGGNFSGVVRQLAQAELAQLPTATTRCLVAAGRIHAPNIVRTAVVYEALWLRHADQLGALYGGRRTASVLARILATSRAFCEAMTGDVGTRASTVDEALQRLGDAATDATEKMYVKLLTGAIGIFPIGTVVELNTGEVGVVMATPKRPIDFARPPVRVMYDAHGSVLAEPFEIDLAARTIDGEPPRVIRRTIETDEQQMKSMRAYVLSLTGRKRDLAAKRPATTAPPPGRTGKTSAGMLRSAPGHESENPPAFDGLEDHTVPRTEVMPFDDPFDAEPSGTPSSPMRLSLPPNATSPGRTELRPLRAPPPPAITEAPPRQTLPPAPKAESPKTEKPSTFSAREPTRIAQIPKASQPPPSASPKAATGSPLKGPDRPRKLESSARTAPPTPPTPRTAGFTPGRPLPRVEVERPSLRPGVPRSTASSSVPPAAPSRDKTSKPGQITREVSRDEFEHLLADASAPPVAPQPGPIARAAARNITREVSADEYLLMMDQRPPVQVPRRPRGAPPVKDPRKESDPPPTSPSAPAGPAAASGEVDALLLTYLVNEGKKKK